MPSNELLIADVCFSFGCCILGFDLKYNIQSVARPALEKFMLSLSKYAVFARMEADEAKKCLSQTDFKRHGLRSIVRRVFFALPELESKSAAFFVSRSLFCLLFLYAVKKRGYISFF
jgi:hypothetical protein